MFTALASAVAAHDCGPGCDNTHPDDVVECRFIDDTIKCAWRSARAGQEPATEIAGAFRTMLVTPELALSAVALGLAAGQTRALTAMLGLTIAAAAALLATLLGMSANTVGAILAPLALAAAGIPLIVPARAKLALVPLAALVSGGVLPILVERAFPLRSPAVAAVCWATLAAGYLAAAAVSLKLNRPWAAIGARILGSWLIAAAVLVAALALRNA